MIKPEQAADLLTFVQLALALWGVYAAGMLLRLSHRLHEAWDNALKAANKPPTERQRRPPRDAFGLVWLMVGLCIAAAVSEAGWVVARAAGNFTSVIRAEILEEIAAGRVVVVLVLLVATAYRRLAERSWTEPPVGR